MSDEADPKALSLSGIAHRCADETDRFFSRQASDPRYCFELFRRALLVRDRNAGDLLFLQYRALVSAWVRRHPAFPGSAEEPDYFVNRAFEKLWTAVTPERFVRFPDLRALLRYLQLCVHSVILDHVRGTKPQVEEEMADEGAGARDPHVPDVAEAALEGASRTEFWHAVDARLSSEHERVVIYGSFVLALKPREILSAYPGRFADVQEIYRCKQNVLERLRRDPELREIASDVL